jgi:glycerol-3-phosphate dehydrogenase
VNSFSSKHRPEIITQLSNTPFDVLVIGGGITGAGIALDATARGLKVALVDMQDFAGGTSSRSTKLIHGGLRYLKQLELKLVAEVGKEREIVHSNAPHLTKPERMLLPIIKNGSLGKFSARIGMWVYEWLAGVKKEEWHKVLSVEETLSIEPSLNRENLLGGILFYEYRTDDARLTIEVLKEASSRGAVALNYAKVVSFKYTNGKIDGAIIQNQLTNVQFEIKATHIVNSTGPWVDELDDLDKNSATHKLHITKGVHLVIDHAKLPIKQSVYFDTPDKRMLFIIPREGKTYIGTTDTFYHDDIKHPTITNEDRDYILNCINQFFPDAKLNIADVESGWAGLRPLINKPNKGPSEISRKDEVFIYESGLLTIAGGKLTGYRKMAQRITDIIAKRIYTESHKKIADCTTQHIQLSGGNIDKKINFKDFSNQKIKEGIALSLTTNESELLVNRYGSNVNAIFKLIKQLNETETNSIPVMLRAQILYNIENEMCVTPSDFFIRRTGALYFDIALVKTWQKEITTYMQQYLKWNDELMKSFTEALQQSIEESERLKIC